MTDTPNTRDSKPKKKFKGKHHNKHGNKPKPVPNKVVVETKVIEHVAGNLILKTVNLDLTTHRYHGDDPKMKRFERPQYAVQWRVDGANDGEPVAYNTLAEAREAGKGSKPVAVAEPEPEATTVDEAPAEEKVAEPA